MRQLTSKEKWELYRNACDWIRPTFDDIFMSSKKPKLYTISFFMESFNINTNDANQLISKLVKEAKLTEIKSGVYKAKRKCTMCNKEFNEWDAQENHYIYNSFGNGSRHKNDIFEADLCCECYDKVVDFIESESKHVVLIDDGSEEAEIRRVKEQRKCSMCDKAFDECDCQENNHIHYHFGYGSSYDHQILDVYLCCCCYDKIIDYIAKQSQNNPFISKENIYE